MILCYIVAKNIFVLTTGFNNDILVFVLLLPLSRQSMSGYRSELWQEARWNYGADHYPPQRPPIEMSVEGCPLTYLLFLCNAACLRR